MSLRRLGAAARVCNSVPESGAGWPRAPGQHGLQVKSISKFKKKGKKRLPTLQKLKQMAVFFVGKQHTLSSMKVYPSQFYNSY